MPDLVLLAALCLLPAALAQPEVVVAPLALSTTENLGAYGGSYSGSYGFRWGSAIDGGYDSAIDGGYDTLFRVTGYSQSLGAYDRTGRASTVRYGYDAGRAVAAYSSPSSCSIGVKEVLTSSGASTVASLIAAAGAGGVLHVWPC